MTLFEVRDRLEEVLYSQAKRFKNTGIHVSTHITYENDDFDECTEDDKRLSSIMGELHVKAEEMNDEDAIILGMSVNCENKNRISENELMSEIERFEAEMDEFLPRLLAAENRAEFINAEIQRSEEETDKMIAELDETVARLDKGLKIGIAVGVAVLVLGIVLALIL